LSRQAEIREKALSDLRESQVLMLDGHFDYGNGYHGRAYLNPHQLFRHPSTIWRFAQDLLDVLPATVLADAEVVAGPVTGGALLAHTIRPAASRRSTSIARAAASGFGAFIAPSSRASSCCSPTM
jgi:orotate phosphoribosyltransferase